ncbi:MAG: hypothetical protein J6S99_06285 [Bacteroidales bacterium]|nr:hypothetical protein [Bacteroidales bacterium]
MNPKTKKAMTQTHKLLSIAALFAAGALTISCNSLKEQLDTPEEVPATGKTVTLTASVGLDATTKALTAAGVKTFAVGDQIAVIYEQEGGAIAKAVSNALTTTDIREEGQKADITVTLDTPAEDGTVRYIYPASMALTTIDPADPIDDAHTIDFTQLSAQDGTLATLAGSYDLAVFDGALNGLELPASALLSNQLAIGEFTVKNSGGDNITYTVTGLKVTDGTNTYTVSRAAAAGPIYVAMLPVANTETLTFIATDNAATPNHFIKLVSGKALESNNMYPVRLTMYPALDVSELTGTYYTITDGYWLYGTQTSTVILRIGDNAHVTFAGVTITPTHFSAGLSCLGSATITLAAGTTNSVTSGNKSFAGIRAGSTGTTLTIGGEGTLTARCKPDSSDEIFGAGIGASNNTKCGNIEITGGTIYAYGGSHAAGIGSGLGAGGSSFISQCGDITISGGTVVAVGGFCSAGIGSGAADGGSSHCGAVTITEGARSVTATGSKSIGEGIDLGHGTSCGVITIDGHLLADAERDNPALASFTHFNSVYDTSHYSTDYTYTWTLTHK